MSAAESVAFVAQRYLIVPSLVAFAIAAFSVFMMIEIVKRIRAADREMAIGWLLAGGLCVGTGVWAEHFVGLLSLDLPFKVGFDATHTLLSWLLTVMVLTLIQAQLSRPALAWSWRLFGVVVAGSGLSWMHYLGVQSLAIAPGIEWDAAHAWLPAVIALGGGALASISLRGVLDSPGAAPLTRLIVATATCGVVLRSFQWTMLAAVRVPPGAQSGAANQLSGEALVDLVAFASALLLVVTYLTVMLAKRLRVQNDHLSHTLRSAHSELASSAWRDALTQLPNRQGFEHQLGNSTQWCDEFNEPLSVLYINLDGFKIVNDSFGHATGDALLQQAAGRLGRLIRHDDLLARAAGDEFVLLLRGTQDPAAVAQLAQRISESLSQPFKLDGHEIELSCSIGVALYPQDGPATTLIARANAAMQTAKRAGGAAHCFFEPSMQEGCADQIDLQRDLRQAIGKRQLMLYYQPKRDARSGEISGAEALLRWKHPARGMVSPGEFIPVAERFGLIGALGNWVIDEACRQLRAWLDQGLRLPVAINLSVHQLRQPDLDARIRHALKRHRVPPELLICEITESVAMENTQASMRVFEQLAAIGVQLSIDDFGTGYSSLSYLRKLPASQLKIDRSFVQDLDKSHDARAIVEAVVRLAHALGLSVVAEGVETRAQQDILLELDCDEFQGFLFARPMPAGDVQEWLRTSPRPETALSDLFSHVPAMA
ncbi:putative bifunctional diguanylate cyclase/phosphodiesterase [Aquabacterium sp.]|uniref:putative bifunctional diguanylate cyclase/phosphodiesterase n=1 Tax=Aquabacterium sp. TaxID=1872578 RepID=UPI0035B41824